MHTDPDDINFQSEELAQALIGLPTSRTPRLAGSPASVARGYETARDIVDPWIPPARTYRRSSQSPAEQTRWDRLVQSVSHPRAHRPTLEGLIMFTGNARDFLGALVEAGHPGPQAHEISEHLLMAVKDGTYKKGSALSAKKIAATLQAPVTRVALALADLAHAGYINITATGRATVAGRTPPSVDRALQHASEADPAAIADLALQQAEQ